jgi:hypothetical protein
MLEPKIKLKVAFLALALLLPFITGIVCNEVYSIFGAEAGWMQHENTLVPTILNKMPGDTIYEMILVCALVAIICTTLGIILSRRMLLSR